MNNGFPKKCKERSDEEKCQPIFPLSQVGHACPRHDNIEHSRQDRIFHFDTFVPYFSFETVGTFDIAYSASAVMVSDGLTPGLAGMIEPSMMYRPG